LPTTATGAQPPQHLVARVEAPFFEFVFRTGGSVIGDDVRADLPSTDAFAGFADRAAYCSAVVGRRDPDRVDYATAELPRRSVRSSGQIGSMNCHGAGKIAAAADRVCSAGGKSELVTRAPTRITTMHSQDCGGFRRYVERPRAAVSKLNHDQLPTPG